MSTLGELRAALELALDWYEPKHDDVVPRWVVLARVALVAEGQGDAWLDPKSLGIPLQHESSAATPSLHKEGLQARFTRALANNNILEQMILANWKAGSNPATSININGLINDLVDVLGEVMGHKEGAGGECPYKKQHNVGYRCPHCGAIEPLPLQRTLPDEQFKGVVVEPIGTQGEAETMLKFREYSQWTEEQSAWLARKWRKAGDESNERKTARAYFNCAQDIEEFFRAAASPAGRVEQAVKDGKE